MSDAKGVIFDLYGTLLRLESSRIHRRLPRMLGVRGAEWMKLAREQLLVRSFSTDEEMAQFICEQLAPGREDLIEPCCALIRDERDTIQPIEGAATLVAFLRRRGWKTGLISNLSSSYKGPVETYGIGELFDVMTFSCDAGITKPAPRIYLQTLEVMGVTPERCVMIGDSLPLDIEGPRRIGMKAVQIGAGDGREISRLGLLDFDRLLATGEEVSVLGEGHGLTIEGLVADEEQGRYNLVWRARTADGAVAYVKRYMLPESAHVESLAWTMYALLDMPRCNAHLLGEIEPVLVVSAAAGAKYAEQAPLDDDLARELGRHQAFAYIFSNADIRPRNAFIDRSDGVCVTMIDLEHCFFDLAIDVSGLADPYDPGAIDRAAGEPDRVAKRVLSDRAMRRARRSFIEEEKSSPSAMNAFRAGFTELFGLARERSETIIGALRERVEAKPPLIIGTHAWRRAMAQVDVDGMERRMHETPEDVLARFC